MRPFQVSEMFCLTPSATTVLHSDESSAVCGVAYSTILTVWHSAINWPYGPALLVFSSERMIDIHMDFTFLWRVLQQTDIATQRNDALNFLKFQAVHIFAQCVVGVGVLL